MEENRRDRVLAKGSAILSLVLHPVFIPVYGLLIIFYAPTFMAHLPASLKKVVLLLAAANMTLVPLAVMPLLKYRNIISSYNMDKRSERIIPLALGTMMYIVTSLIFFSYQVPVILKSFLLAATLTSAILLVITFIWKISLHSAGMGSLLAVTIVLSLRMMANLMIIWVLLIIVSGLLMAARLYLKSHSPAQVYAGFLTGFLTVFLIMVLV